MNGSDIEHDLQLVPHGLHCPLLFENPRGHVRQ